MYAKKIISVWVLCVVALALQAAPITVASWNVENYLSTDRMVEGVYKTDYPKPESEKVALVAVVKAQAPDVLVVCEMGTRPYFEELKARLARAGVVYPYAVLLEKTPDSERHLGVLSKIPFELVEHKSVAFKYFGGRAEVLRGMLEARFGKAGEPGAWKLYGVHLKSRHTQRDDDVDSQEFRVGEAEALRDIIGRNRDAAPYLVMGDFNDGPKSRAVKRFTVRNKTILAEVLKITDSRGEVWTHAWKSESSYSRIDHILASTAMLPAVVPGSAKIVDSPEVLEASDHRMVRVTIDPALLN